MLQDHSAAKCPSGLPRPTPVITRAESATAQRPTSWVCGPIRVFELRVAEPARQAARSKTYRDNPVLVAIKVLELAGTLVSNKSEA